MSYVALDAGRLDKRVTIQTVSRSDDGGGGGIDTYSDVVTVWASIESPSGNESIVAQGLEANIQHLVKIRYRAGVSAKHRLVYGSRIFPIHAVLDVDERHEQLALYCSEVTTAATEMVAAGDDVGDTPEAIAIIKTLLGPMVDVADLPNDVPSFYEANWSTNETQQWTDFGSRWDAGNSISGYDRAAILYAWYARTGNATYLDHAHQTAVAYRDNYVIPANYGVSPHWSQLEGLALHWLLTGDVASRTAVIAVANVLSAFPESGYFDVTQGDARIQARVILALWLAETLEGATRPMLDTAITRALSVMNADGYAPFNNTCGGSLNYMNGMLYDVLTRIHDQRARSYNADILTAATAFGTYLWSTQWRGATPGDASFNYISLVCELTGSPTSAPDLNGLLLPLFGWLGKTTSNSAWFTKGDQVLAGMADASTYLYRQFSESYTSSYRYIGYKHPELVA